LASRAFVKYSSQKSVEGNKGFLLANESSTFKQNVPKPKVKTSVQYKKLATSIYPLRGIF